MSRAREAITAADTVATECADALTDQATAFTCSEADQIATFLGHFATPRTGAAFLHAHSAGDDEGDDHHGWTEAMCLDVSRARTA